MYEKKVTDIKLRREKDEWGNTFYIYENADAPYLKRAKISKHYSYSILDLDENYYVTGKYTYLSTLADVKAFIATYDSERYEAELLKKAEEAEREAAYLRKRMAEVAANKAFIENRLDDVGMVPVIAPAVGSFVDVAFPSANKNCMIGEYINELSGEYGASVERAKVIKVVELDAEAFADVANGLMNDDLVKDYLKDEEGGFIGGTASDASELDGIDFHVILNDERLRDIWDTTRYVHVVAFVNKGRVIIANSEGYSYIRYAGFMVSSLAGRVRTDEAKKSSSGREYVRTVFIAA